MTYGDLVSIIVPTYNRAHLIARSVGCLLKQSYPNIEIVLVDDCSTDDIEGAVADLNDPRVKLIRREKNEGASAARNAGVAAAKGELIAFHDSDDLCLFNKIEQQVRALEGLPDDYIGVYTAVLFYTLVDEGSYSQMKTHILPDPSSSQLSGDMYRPTVNGNVMNLPTMLLKKDALTASGGLDERLRNNNDWDLTLRLTRLGKFHFLPEPYYIATTVLAQTDVTHHISRSQKFSAKSFAFITGKLRRSGERSSELARHYYTTAGILLRLGRSRFGRRYLRAALAINPFHLRSLLLYPMSYVNGLYPALRQLKKRRVSGKT